MKDILLQFLRKNASCSKPILLGVSGGPDSLVLLFLMLACQDALPVRIGIAHVDHRWRPESKQEALQLEALAKQHGIPFHLKVLDNTCFEGNIEAYCRKERLKFFAETCQSYGYQAVALGHHADDLAETVLKRLLEGASLPYIEGMREVTCIGGTLFWRPLLPIAKSEILKVAQSLPFQPFVDATNLDSRFLRGRFRTSIIPFLSQTFGKQVSAPLRKLSAESTELKEYLKSRLSPFLKNIQRGPLGLFMDLGAHAPEHLIELKFAIRCLCEEAGFRMSDSSIVQAAKFVLEKKTDRFFASSGGFIYLDRGRLFVSTKGLKTARWAAAVQQMEYGNEPNLSGWQNVWKGRVEVFLPEAEYELKAPVLRQPYPRTSSLSKLWTNLKVPAFLRSCIPAVWHNNCLVYEFLTGKTFHKLDAGQKVVKIALSMHH